MSNAEAMVAAAPVENWMRVLEERIPLYGHRNWIVVADSAYPVQANSGIETILADGKQVDVVANVLSEISSSGHVKPIVYTDQELRFVEENDAPGISNYRSQLAKILDGRELRVLPHENIISMLDEAAKLFRVLIIKTKLTIPYTSVFFQLDCAYWNDSAEARLRKLIADSPSQ